jgi:orotate phosphoribosyltransferase
MTIKNNYTKHTNTPKYDKDKDNFLLSYLRSEIDHKCIYRVAPGQVGLPAKAANRKYTWQFYLRRCLFDPHFVFSAAQLLVNKIPDIENIQIGACEDAGVPIGMAMSTLTGNPFITVKKNRKSYGLLNFTEGRFTGQPILLVDDLAGSGATIKNSMHILLSFNIPIADYYATLIDKTQGTHKNNYIKDKQLVSLFTCEDFSMTWNAYVDKYNKEPEFGNVY